MRIASATLAAVLFGSCLVALPATALAPASSAAAADVLCGELVSQQPCSLDYTTYPGHTTIDIPDSITEVTVLLAGGSGGTGDDQGAAGPGGIVIATIDTRQEHVFDLWLGGAGAGRTPGEGWARGGEGGEFEPGNDGYGGGGASGLGYAGDGKDYPLMVAGGGGGGGGAVFDSSLAGGAGGFGGNPAGNGANGQGKVWGPGGQGGAEGSWNGGPGGSDTSIDVGAGGGGGGGGYFGGTGGSDGTYIYGEGYNSAGGGGGGGSYARETIELLGYGTAPLGAGWVTIYPGGADRLECDSSNDWTPLSIPDDVVSYSVVAVGGGGAPGASLARAGHGGVVTATVDVSAFDSLYYDVGCGGDSERDNGLGFGGGGDGGHASSPEARSGGKGGGATALLAPDGTPLVVAGGGGGAGGDIANCNDAPGSHCGGAGGSSGGTPGSALPPNGATGDGGTGGDGGIAGSHHVNGVPNRNGGAGTGPDGGGEDGGGGGGGGGYPMGGGGGHHSFYSAGGGGGAGDSYINSQYAEGSIATSGAEATEHTRADGWLVLLPNVVHFVDVLVQKEVTGAGDGFAQGPFTLRMVCDLTNRTIVDETFTLGVGGSQVLQAPVDASCTVTESGTGDASTPAPPQIFIVADTNPPITMVNDFAATSLIVQLSSEIIAENGEVTDTVALQPGDVLVGISCTLAGHELVLPNPTVNGLLTLDADGSFTAPVTATLEPLPVNAECVLHQQSGAHVSNTTYSFNGTQLAPGERFALTAGTNEAGLTNGYGLRPLTISKALAGNGTPPAGSSFDGTASCTFNGAPVVFDTAPTFGGLTVDDAVLLHDLPAFARCTVTETGTADATGVSYSPARTIAISPEETELQITNTFDTGTLVVRVEGTGAGMPWANHDLGIHVTCTDGTDETVTLPPGGGVRTWTPDLGATCTVTQTDAGGATTTSYSSSADPTPSAAPVDVTVGAEPVSLFVDDLFEAAPLDVSVTAGGPGERFANASAVTVHGCTFNGEPIDIDPGAASLDFDFAPAGGTASIPELVVGATCAVSLTADGGASSVEYSVSGAASVAGDSVDATVTSAGTSVAFATTFDLGALAVEVALEGAGAWAANVAPVAVVTCTLDGTSIDQLGPDGAVSLHFSPDGTPVDDHGRELLGDLPIGASCVVDETEDGGATTVSYAPASTVMIATDTDVTITNAFPASSITIGATVAGNDAVAHENEPFTFELGCTFNDLPIGAPPNGPDQPRSFALVDGAAETFDQLPVGADCTVVEVDTRHATSVSPGTEQNAAIDPDGVALDFINTFDVASLTLTEFVTGPGAETYGDGQTFFARALCTYADGAPADLLNGGVHWLDAEDDFSETFPVPVGTTCTARQPLQLASSQVVSPPVSIVLGQSHVVTITSEFDLGDLRTTKSARGDFAASLQFGFEVECTAPARDWPVQGQPRPDERIALPLNGGAATSFGLVSGGSRLVQVLDGASCTTTEVASHDALRVDVVATGANGNSSGAQGTVVVRASTPALIAVTNYMTGSLPVTGAELAILVPIALALVVLGLLALLLRWRRVARLERSSG